jgi:hypothetical protein
MLRKLRTNSRIGDDARRFLMRGIFAACMLAAGAAAADQGLPSTTPESVGLSSERLERIATAVQRSALSTFHV